MIKVYKIKLDGKTYEVEVESVSEKEGKIETSQKVAKPAPTSGEGIAVNAPMQGVVLDIKVNVGDTVSKGDTLLVLEAMKMENQIVAPENGTINSISVSKGETVNSGSVMITIS